MAKLSKEEIVERFGPADHISSKGHMYYFKQMIQVQKQGGYPSSPSYRIRFLRVKDNKIEVYNDNGIWVAFDNQVRLKAALDNYIVENIILSEDISD